MVDGVEVSLASARHAQDLGIAAIYQEPMSFPDLSVAENIFISHRDRGRVIDRRRMRRDADRIRRRLGVQLDVGRVGPRPDAGGAEDGRDREGVVPESSIQAGNVSVVTVFAPESSGACSAGGVE